MKTADGNVVVNRSTLWSTTGGSQRETEQTTEQIAGNIVEAENRLLKYCFTSQFDCTWYQ